MPRALNKLTDAVVRATAKPGRHSDGGGLYLLVSPAGTKSWTFLWTANGRRRREMGCGSYPTVSLAAARKRAGEYRTAVEAGRDPLAEREAARQAEAPLTFGEVVTRFLDDQRMSQWKNEKHRHNGR